MALLGQREYKESAGCPAKEACKACRAQQALRARAGRPGGKVRVGRLAAKARAERRVQQARQGPRAQKAIKAIKAYEETLSLGHKALKDPLDKTRQFQGQEAKGGQTACRAYRVCKGHQDRTQRT